MNGSWRSLAKSEGGEREGEEGIREGGLRWGCGGTVAGEGEGVSQVGTPVAWHQMAAKLRRPPLSRPRRPPF